MLEKPKFLSAAQVKSCCHKAKGYSGDYWNCVGKPRQGVGCSLVSGIAGGTFPLDCFGLSFEDGLWIEIVMALCLSVVSARVPFMHPNNDSTVKITWGDYPSWINLVFTLIAAGAAIYAGIQAKRILDIEMKRDRDNDLLRRQDQANFVSGWSRPALVGFSNMSNFCLPAIEACVQNNSGQCIYDVKISWWISGDVEHKSFIGLIPPNEERCRSMPGELLEKFVGVEDYSVSAINAGQADEECLTVCEGTRLEICFTDSKNQKWIRDKSGNLILL